MAGRIGHVCVNDTRKENNLAFAFCVREQDVEDSSIGVGY